MENNPILIKNKAAVEILNALGRTVSVLQDEALCEAFNRIEFQAREYDETGEACDLTYLRDLCNQYADRLIAFRDAHNSAIRSLMENAEGPSDASAQESVDSNPADKNAPVGKSAGSPKAKIGFHSR